MRRRLIAIVLATLAAFAVFSPASADPDFSQPVGYVNDFANIIPDDVEASLEAKLQEYEQATTNQIVVVTVPSLEGKSVEDYTIELARDWGVGQKDKDNGIVILVAPNERKVRIEVGYGLEGDLPDAIAKRIIEQEMTPRFKGGDLAGGIVAGVDAVVARLNAAAQGGPLPEEDEKAGGGVDGATVGIVLGAVFGGIALIVGMIVLIVWAARSYQRWRAEEARKASVREETTQRIADVQGDLKDALSNLGRFRRS